MMDATSLATQICIGGVLGFLAIVVFAAVAPPADAMHAAATAASEGVAEEAEEEEKNVERKNAKVRQRPRKQLGSKDDSTLAENDVVDAQLDEEVSADHNRRMYCCSQVLSCVRVNVHAGETNRVRLSLRWLQRRRL
jgi:uncharacterized protein YpuA (DUF1002 family)